MRLAYALPLFRALSQVWFVGTAAQLRAIQKHGRRTVEQEVAAWHGWPGFIRTWEGAVFSASVSADGVLSEPKPIVGEVPAPDVERLRPAVERQRQQKVGRGPGGGGGIMRRVRRFSMEAMGMIGFKTQQGDGKREGEEAADEEAEQGVTSVVGAPYAVASDEESPTLGGQDEHLGAGRTLPVYFITNQRWFVIN
jgi:hypothetical protein